MKFSNLKARFFCLIKDNSEHDLGINADERKNIEVKLKELRDEFSSTRIYLQSLNLPYMFFIRDENFIDVIDDEFNKIKKKEDFDLYHQFLNQMMKSICEYRILIEKSVSVSENRKQLNIPHKTQENKIFLDQQLKANQEALSEQYEKCMIASAELTQSTLLLSGKSSPFKIFSGIGLLASGWLMVGAAVALFFAAPALPLVALISTIALGAAVITLGAILIHQGRQQGFSKATYTAARAAEREANSFTKSLLR